MWVEAHGAPHRSRHCNSDQRASFRLNSQAVLVNGCCVRKSHVALHQGCGGRSASTSARFGSAIVVALLERVRQRDAAHARQQQLREIGKGRVRGALGAEELGDDRADAASEFVLARSQRSRQVGIVRRRGPELDGRTEKRAVEGRPDRLDRFVDRGGPRWSRPSGSRRCAARRGAAPRRSADHRARGTGAAGCRARRRRAPGCARSSSRRSPSSARQATAAARMRSRVSHARFCTGSCTDVEAGMTPGYRPARSVTSTT